jgi:hypothetical protein
MQHSAYVFPLLAVGHIDFMKHRQGASSASAVFFGQNSPRPTAQAAMGALAKSLLPRQPRDTLLPLVTRRLTCASLRG